MCACVRAHSGTIRFIFWDSFSLDWSLPHRFSPAVPGGPGITSVCHQAQLFMWRLWMKSRPQACCPTNGDSPLPLSYPLKQSVAGWMLVITAVSATSLRPRLCFHASFTGCRKPQHLQGETAPALVRLRSVEINHGTY